MGGSNYMRKKTMSMKRKILIFTACLAAVVIGIAAFSVMFDFGNMRVISDDPTPLSEFDYYDENLEQLSADRVLNEIIIKFVDPADVPGKEKQLQNEINKVKKIGFVEEVDAYVVRIDDLEKNPNAVLNRFKNNRFIEYIEPNYILNLSYKPNDPNYTNQSAGFTYINAPTGWDITTGKNRTVTVAVVDSGVASHPDLPKPGNGYSALSSLAYGNDKVGHGTGVAGIIGAIGDNKIGIAGINWNVNILPVKTDDANGNLTVANVANGIIWAANNGAKVINLSLGTGADSSTLKNAIDTAYKKGCAIFAASGNAGKNAVDYPARYSNVMGVGGVTLSGERSSFSNYGTGLDIVAMGGTHTTTASGGYGSATGTSFASPMAAGLASLIYSLNPNLTNDEVYDLIKQNAKRLGGGINTQTGYGIIDIAATLKRVPAYNDPSAPKPADPAPPKPTCTVSPVITLNGFAEVKLLVGDKYEETGYSAVDCLGSNITPYITVSGSVNSAVAGIYSLNYSVSDGYGNSAKATRKVFVEEKPVTQQLPPTITVIGSNPIILHLGSGTRYTEQGAKAVDSDGKDISNKVEVLSVPDRNIEGVYTILYSVVGKNGLEATATRSVHIIAPNTGVKVRDKYGFNGQAKQGVTVPHYNISSKAPGWVDLKVASMDKNMTITVQLVNSAAKKAEVTDTFSVAGSKQYNLGQGLYELVVTVDKANGNAKYTIDLLMPESVTMEYDKKEVAF